MRQEIKKTAEQARRLQAVRDELIEKVLTTQDILSTYPTLPNGRPDFNANLVALPVSRDDIALLVDRYMTYREQGMSHGEAARLTYACCYRSTDVTFDPHARIAELRKTR